MEFLSQIISLVDIKPSSYIHVVTASDRVVETPQLIDEMAELGKFPKLIELWPSLIVAVILSICRMILQKYVFKPLIVSILKLDALDIPKKPVLDQLFKKNHHPNEEELKVFSKESNLTIDVIQREFLLRRRSLVQKKKFSKFVEAAWRCLFYGAFTILGYYTLFVPNPVPWVLDSREHWANWPFQEIYPMVKIYYIIELGAYFHQLVWTEVDRSDSLEMIIHHLLTILLLISSHMVNFVRIGVTVLFIHDISDVFLEAAKCFNYTSKVKGKEWASIFCDTLFAIFAISFFILRLVIYPYWIFWCSYVYADERFGKNWVGFWVYFWLLLALQALHIFWFYLISRMIYRLLTTGIEKDERSDDDCEEEDNNSHNNDNDKNSSKPIAHKKSQKKTQ